MYCIMDSKKSCSMVNPMVIDLTVEESDEDFRVSSRRYTLFGSS